MDILYCYKLDKQTGVICRYNIEEYELTGRGNKQIYKFKHSLGNQTISQHTIEADKIDKFLQVTFYTFNPDIFYAVDEIRKYFRSKVQEYGVQMDKCIKLLSMIDTVNKEFV